MRPINFKTLKSMGLIFQKIKKQGILFSIVSLLLALTMIIPNTGVSLPNPWQLIVNHSTKECANLYIGFGNNEPGDCSIPEGWEEAEYGSADFVCPKGYNNAGRFEGEQCLKLSQDRRNPQRKPHSGGFGCS